MLKIINSKQNIKEIELKFISKIDDNKNLINTEDLAISEFLDQNKILIFIKNIDELKQEKLEKIVSKILSSIGSRNVFIDLEFWGKSEEKILEIFIEYFEEKFVYDFSYKTKEKDKIIPNLTLVTSISEEIYKKMILISKSKLFVKKYQEMPPNIATSEYLASVVEKEFENSPLINVKILNKQDIKNLKMGLLLAVNAGSSHEPRVVELNYNGNLESKNRTVIVGKGITFDTGGYNLKPSKYLSGMKFDMSGAMIASGVMKVVENLSPKINLSVLMVLTDNKISSRGTTPEEIHYAMNGKSIEITDTDAEGRLILADGISYASKILKASEIITIATLTGSVIVALGDKISGVWSTNDESWKKLKKAAKISNEKIWRLPLDEDFLEGLKSSRIADLINYDANNYSDSNSAAIFLKQFTNKSDLIHLDIAGTVSKKSNPNAVLLKTLVNYLTK
ncbi:M17 family metallopeptidase [[Mycoplasma] mobile]|uniref:Probable cytosol aminopeptidase n=1 Tax=Mycoplasma mobile (strain ATCC 43663 / 163K / NCTC 11711) TaxID=267748 RepID=Q6KIB6_MYCM1|nr:leucyl aminopeptidase family protein [[Mycoplasma] mobile]AAT27660.1 leucyl aminopeptidase [Mycoplasma mobile 163K]